MNNALQLVLVYRLGRYNSLGWVGKERVFGIANSLLQRRLAGHRDQVHCVIESTEPVEIVAGALGALLGPGIKADLTVVGAAQFALAEGVSIDADPAGLADDAIRAAEVASSLDESVLPIAELPKPLATPPVDLQECWFAGIRATGEKAGCADEFLQCFPALFRACGQALMALLGENSPDCFDDQTPEISEAHGTALRLLSLARWLHAFEALADDDWLDFDYSGLLSSPVLSREKLAFDAGHAGDFAWDDDESPSKNLGRMLKAELRERSSNISEALVAALGDQSYVFYSLMSVLSPDHSRPWFDVMMDMLDTDPDNPDRNKMRALEFCESGFYGGEDD